MLKANSEKIFFFSRNDTARLKSKSDKAEVKNYIFKKNKITN